MSVSPSKGRLRGLNITVPHILMALGVVLSIVVLSSFAQKMEDTRSIRAEGSRLRATATALMIEKQALMVTQVYVESDAFTRSEAPSVIKYMPADARLVVVVTPEYVPRSSDPTPIPAKQPVKVDNWHVWREMFFGPQD